MRMASLIFFSFVIAILPDTNNLLLLARVQRKGLEDLKYYILGMVAGAYLSLSFSIYFYNRLFNYYYIYTGTFRVLAGIYLVYLTWSMLYPKARVYKEWILYMEKTPVRLFIKGAIVSLLNVKIILYASRISPLFLSMTGNNVLNTILCIMLVVTILLLSGLLWCVLGYAANKLFYYKTNIVKICMGIMFLLCIAMLIY